MSDTTFRAKAPAIMRGLMDHFEIKAIHAAGILGNLGHECKGFTDLHEDGQPEGQGGYGWGQWTGPRRKEFMAWCEAKHLPWQCDDANYGFLVHELNGSEKSAISAILKTTTLEAAVQAFERNFERAGVQNYASRNRWAAIALAEFNSRNAPA